MFHRLIQWLKAKLPHNLKQLIKKVLGVGLVSEDVKVMARVETNPDDINVAVHTGGGIGDFIVYKLLLENLINNYCCHVCLFTLSYKNAETVLGQTKNLNIYYPSVNVNKTQFDLILEIDHYVNIRDCNATSLKRKSSKLYESVNKILEYNKTNIPSSGNFLAQRNVIIFRAKYTGINRWTQLSCGGVFDMSGMHSGITVDKSRSNVLNKYNVNEGEYITISCGADVDMGGIRQVKVWPIHRYEEFVNLFCEKYPQIKIIQLLKMGEPQIAGIDLLLQNLDFEDAKIILTNSKAHISNEGGLVHTATQLGTRCIVAFGPTPVHYYGYPTNTNVVSSFCTGCMESTKDWFIKCPRGFETAKCMDAITGEMMLEAFGKGYHS